MESKKELLEYRRKVLDTIQAYAVNKAESMNGYALSYAESKGEDDTHLNNYNASKCAYDALHELHKTIQRLSYEDGK